MPGDATSIAAPDRGVPAPAVRVVPDKNEWWKLLALASLALVLALTLMQFVWMIARPLAILFGAIVIAEAMMPAVDRLAKFMPRVLATLAMYAALIAVFVGIGLLVFPPLVTQAQEVVDRMPELIEDGRDVLNRWDPGGEGRVEEFITSQAQGGAGALASLPLTVVSSVVEVFLVFVMSIYWVIAAPNMRRFLLSLFPEHRRSHAEDVLGEMGSAIGRYVRGTAFNALVVGSIVYVGLLIIGVPYPLVLALLAALGEFVPIAGPIIAGAPAVLLALLESPAHALIVLVFYVVLQQIESNILLPVVMSSQAHVPPLLVLFAIFVGGSIGGILGALIAIPLSGALRVLVIRVIAPAVRAWSGASPETDQEPLQGG
ncbi:MAG TPA: AI-2E family transporter [Thermomicrobiales bacterium]|nr:AI-2E family transporter [Thermomicrobiales bacterium]